MSEIEFSKDMIQINAEIVAKAFRISSDELKQRMRDGTITSQSEHGADEDAGKIRLTFFSADRRVRVTADDSGKLLTCSAVDSRRRTVPAVSTDVATKASIAMDEVKRRLDGLLDVALEGTFPASDPVALGFDLAKEDALWPTESDERFDKEPATKTPARTRRNPVG
ncbi:DUF6522 family protein [Roseovarius sp. Pro17]|uniref:DUF6522 family protein n=1 Tax=Roseovarius sp. Pro17 TaxID=3108175 RepID=UPI002D79187C|nr:DUF6522 family protein [Roseovarius sp. Pro17]